MHTEFDYSPGPYGEVREDFDFINCLIFDGALKEPDELFVGDLWKEGWFIPCEDGGIQLAEGYCDQEEDGHTVIALNDLFVDEMAYQDTLCHEMVHLWQIQVLGHEPDHEESFKRWIKPCKKWGYYI